MDIYPLIRILQFKSADFYFWGEVEKMAAQRRGVATLRRLGRRNQEKSLALHDAIAG
jgi:hypothetical protein